MKCFFLHWVFITLPFRSMMLLNKSSFKKQRNVLQDNTMQLYFPVSSRYLGGFQSESSAKYRILFTKLAFKTLISPKMAGGKPFSLTGILSFLLLLSSDEPCRTTSISREYILYQILPYFGLYQART